MDDESEFAVTMVTAVGAGGSAAEAVVAAAALELPFSIVINMAALRLRSSFNCFSFADIARRSLAASASLSFNFSAAETQTIIGKRLFSQPHQGCFGSHITLKFGS